MSPFPHERKEAEGGEDPSSEEKAPQKPYPSPENLTTFPHKPILLRNPTNIGRKAKQYRSRHEAIELGGRSNIALNASYKRNVRLPKGKGEADEEKETEP